MWMSGFSGWDQLIFLIMKKYSDEWYLPPFVLRGIKICVVSFICMFYFRKMGIPEFLDSGRKSWTLDSGRWTLDAGLWTLDSRRWNLGAGLWVLGSGPWTLLLTVTEQNQNPVYGLASLNYWKVFQCKSLRTMITLVL